MDRADTTDTADACPSVHVAHGGIPVDAIIGLFASSDHPPKRGTSRKRRVARIAARVRRFTPAERGSFGAGGYGDF
ncbi:MAG: hypothetical protein JWR14_703 [Caballeronia sp.]|jgi:hypothetical protein|nr:hypothetical protein [Caballeronia sp.]